MVEKLTEKKLKWIEKKLASAIEAALKEGFYLITGTMIKKQADRGVGVCAQGALVRHEKGSTVQLLSKVRRILRINNEQQGFLMIGFDSGSSFLSTGTGLLLIEIGKRLRNQYLKIDGSLAFAD